VGNRGQAAFARSGPCSGFLRRSSTSLEAFDAAAFLIDADGKVVWRNRLGEQLLVEPSSAEVRSIVHGDAPYLDASRESTDATGRRSAVRLFGVPVRREEGVAGLLALAVRSEAEAPDASTGRSLRLTPRQHEVLTPVAQGMGTKEIALRLGISQQTTRNHVRAVLHALGARSRVEAVVLAQRLRLVG
jgi:DNA-binding CsgD family transcriptional regulator